MSPNLPPINIDVDKALKVPEAIWRPARIMVNGQEVDVHGVSHIRKTFFAYQNDFERVIRESDMIMVEAGAYLSTFAEYDRLMKEDPSNPEKAVRENEKEVARNNESSFFDLLMLLIVKNEKIVIGVPPYDQGTINRSAVEAAGEVWHRNTILMAFGGVALALKSVYSAIRGVYQEKQEATPEASITMSRRKFLLAAAGIAGGAAMSLPVISNYQYELPLQDRSIIFQNGQYNILDFRDILAARTIDSLTQKMNQKSAPGSKKKRIAVFFGVAHQQGILYYLENREIREAKLKLYKPLMDAMGDMPPWILEKFTAKSGWDDAQL